MTIFAFKLRLAPAIERRAMFTLTARLRGVLRRHNVQNPTTPVKFVLKLSFELKPALIQNGLVESSFLLHTTPRLFHATFCRPRHVGNLQIFQYDRAVVFGYPVCGFMQKIMPNPTNFLVDLLKITPLFFLFLRTSWMLWLVYLRIFYIQKLAQSLSH